MKRLNLKSEKKILIRHSELIVPAFQTSEKIINMLLAEWAIWSKCFGKVIVITGVSSAGKSTLSEYFKKFGFHVLNQDYIFVDLIIENINKENSYIFLAKSFLTENDMLKVLCGFKVSEKTYTQKQQSLIKHLQEFIELKGEHSYFPSLVELYDRMYNIAQKFIFSGQDIVVDVVAAQGPLEMLSSSFRHYPMVIGLLYAPLEDNLSNCFQRNNIALERDEINYRYPSQVINQYIKFYNFLPKDKISKANQVVGKIDKILSINVLKAALCFEDLLISKLEKLKVYEYKPVNNMLNLLTKLKALMFLGTRDETFVVSAIKYDFIVKSIDLSLNKICIEKICDMVRTIDYHEDSRSLVFIREEALQVIGETQDIIEY